jgi:hypothetical protein
MATGLNTNDVLSQAIQGGEVAACSATDPNDPATISCPPAGGLPAGGVRVTKTYANVPLFFGQFVNGGQGTTNIQVTATAWLGGPGGLSPELPVALCLQDIYVDPNVTPRVCVNYYYTEFSPNNSDNAGWWNKVGVGQPSASECKAYVNNPETIPFLKVGELIDLNNGEITACHKEIDDRFDRCNAASCVDGHPDKDFCTVILPVVNCQNSINNNEPVQEFAAVCITNVKSTPASQAVIEGVLTCNVPVPDSIGGGPTQGVYAERPVLIQ